MLERLVRCGQSAVWPPRDGLASLQERSWRFRAAARPAVASPARAATSPPA